MCFASTYPLVHFHTLLEYPLPPLGAYILFEWPAMLNISVSNDLTQMVNFLTWIPDCEWHSPALLDLIICFNPSIYSTVAYYCSDQSMLQTQGMLLFIAQLVAILMLIGTCFTIFWETLLVCNCYWLLWVGLGWNWCTYPSS